MKIASINLASNSLGSSSLNNQPKPQQPAFGRYEFAEGVMKTVHAIDPSIRLTRIINDLRESPIRLKDYAMFDRVALLMDRPEYQRLGDERLDLRVRILDIVDEHGEKNVYNTRRVKRYGNYETEPYGDPIGTEPTRSVSVKYSIPAFEDLGMPHEFTEKVPIICSDISGTLEEVLDRNESQFHCLSDTFEKIKKNVEWKVFDFVSGLTKKNRC